MRVAIVGTGIAGNVAAYHLNKAHDITVYEAGSHVGGHTNTIDVDTAGGRLPVDTGFIVFNDRTYPNFIRLLDELGVHSQDSEMSFSVRGTRPSLEYNGSHLDGLFAQRSNLLRPSFIGMIRDILRFNREAPLLLDDQDTETTLGQYLRREGYSKAFVRHYLVPMGAAIWSAEPEMMDCMPAHFFIRFFANHGLLSLDDRPQWRVIRGGSREYVKKLVAGHIDRIRLNCPVESVTRLPDRVIVRARGMLPEEYDAVFLACHSDQALRLLADPSAEEERVLGAIRYQFNRAVLHTDSSMMPRRRRAWASWNYHLAEKAVDSVTLTYHMNRLQRLDCDEQFFVTLNSGHRIDPQSVIHEIDYDHPVFTTEAVQAQSRKPEIDGVNRTYYCGAYWRYGFHEDGVVSALSALQRFEQEGEYAQQHLQRAS
jgi:predicted NAD/FAD-binding protein